MTNSEVMNLKAGDTVIQTCNGYQWTHVIREVTAVGRCINERSKCFGHAYACFRGTMGTLRDVSTSLHSDEYTNGEGYPTHDKDGRRLRGWELA